MACKDMHRKKKKGKAKPTPFSCPPKPAMGVHSLAKKLKETVDCHCYSGCSYTILR